MARLIVSAGAGVMIRILDAAQQLCGWGYDRIEFDGPEGIYAIQWDSAGLQTETLVRLVQSDPPIEVRYDPHLAGDSVAAVAGPWPTSSLVSQVGEQLRPSERSYGSSVAIVLTADPDVSVADFWTGLRLFNNVGKAMRAGETEGLPLSLSERDEARCYRVRPGRYRLQFRSLLGETLQQSVPALAGRQTIIFLCAGAVSVLVSENDRFTPVRREGIDPARTVIATVEGDEEDERIRERVRLAGVLLNDLATGGTSISREFVAILDDPRTDPILKLYGAAVVLSRLELGAMPLAEEPLAGKQAKTNPHDMKWGIMASKWISDPATVGLPPDATAANWRLFAIFPGLKKTHRPVSLPRRIQVPPMLECSWRWSIERSVKHPTAVKGTASVMAAGRAAAGAGPWLCWKVSAAKAAQTATPLEKGANINELAWTLATRSMELIESDDRISSPSGLIDILSADATATALRVNQLATGRERNSSIETELALALNLPAPQLKRHLADALAEMDEVLENPPRTPLSPARDSVAELAGDEPALPPAAAPGLKRRIYNPDDPQKGRFGGQPEQAGFKLSARFKETKSKNWTRIILTVRGKARDGSQAMFYVHDSFKPPEYERPFRNGKAELTLTAWGGFTVGVWIPEQRVELELDLAQLSKAPRNIQTR